MEEDTDVDMSQDNNVESSDDDVSGASEAAIEDGDVWKYINEIADDGDIVKAYITVVLMYRNLGKDKVHREVMKTVNRFRDGENNMEFKEAFANAIAERRHLILAKKIKKDDNSNDDDTE